jgi:putative heme-binding domain-containing protein
MNYKTILFIATFQFISSTYAFAQRDLKDIPDPDPELERQSFIVADGFEVNLYAADPLIAKPIQMNFDAQGRLWIASSEVYPQIRPGQKATDKILVLEDQDRNGVAEKTTVFADGLFIPTGVLPGDGGVYVANSTELIHLKDIDQDGKADQTKIVLSGFGTEDTHHLLHTLRWGHDGQLYMNQSIYIHSHIETPYGVKRLNGGGIWRFRPETLELDVLAYGFVNSWGHHFDYWGQSFATDGAYGEGINYVFPGSVFVSAPGASRIMAGLNPGSPKHCSLEILSGRHLPDDWQGNMLTNDFRAHRVCRFVVTEDNAGYASRQETEVIKTTHRAFRPIDVKMGPDGAIYIADWYNPIIQHGEVDFRDERRDHVHGRIWRVTAKNRPPLNTAIPADASVAELLERLKAPEEWTRLWAKLMLKAKGEREVLPALESWVQTLDKQDNGYEHHRLEALWLYQNLQVVNRELLGALLISPDHRVRAAAVRVASQWKKELKWGNRSPNIQAILDRAVQDEHPRVRLEAVRALAEIPTLEAAQLAAQGLDRPQDRFLDFALWKTFRDLSPVWIPALKEGSFNFGGNVDHLTYALRAVDSPDIAAPLLALVTQQKVPEERVAGVLGLVASVGGANEMEKVLDWLLDHEQLSGQQRAAILDTLVESSHARKLVPAGDLSRLEKWLATSDDTLRSAAARAAGAWKVEKFRPILTEWGTHDDAVSDPLQIAALEALSRLGGPASLAALQQVAEKSEPFIVRIQAMEALVKLDVNLAAALAVKLFQTMPTDAEVGSLLASLLVQKQGPAALVKSLANQTIPADTAKRLVRVVRQTPQPSADVLAALQQAGKLADAGWKSTPELVNGLVAEVQSQGNAERGEAIYRRKDMACIKCHGIAGAGGVVGPGLESIGASAPIDYLVDSMLEPNKKVKEGFHSQMIATDEGKIFTGIPVRETPQELVLRDAEDRLHTIAKESIDERKDGRSLMPDGLVNELTRAELIDLIRFLSELGKVGGKFAVDKSRVVRRWQSLTWTADAHKLLNRTSYDSAATNNTALQWEANYSRVAGDLPADDLAKFEAHKGLDPTLFVRFEIDVSTAGKLELAFEDIGGLTLWIDGKPTTILSNTPLDLATGRHVVTLAVNCVKRTSPLRVELRDVVGSPAQAQLVGGK